MKLHLCVAALLVFPAAVAAQGNPGPFGGMFGRTPNRSGVNYKVFELRGSTGAQWDDVVFGPASNDGSLGTSANAAAGAVFEQRSDRLHLRAGSLVDYRQSLRARPVGGTSVDGGLMLATRPTTRVSAEASINYRYSPFFQYYPSYVWLSDGLVVPGSPFVATAIDNQSTEARLSGSYHYSKSSTLTASVSRRETWLSDVPEGDSTTTSFHGTWSRRLNRDFSLRLGYGKWRFQYHTAGAEALIQEEIEAGVDFSRALTVSPKTTVSFTSSTSVLRQGEGDARYRLNGSFSLSHRFQRTWKTSVYATRQTQFVMGFFEPMFVDTAGFAVGGMLADRLEWVTNFNATRGESVFSSVAGHLITYGAATQLNFALTRHLGLYAQYGLYHHDVPVGISSIAVANRLSRQTVTAGISAWLPVFTRERSQ